MSVDRRRFLLGGFGATVLASMPADLFADASPPPPDVAWDHGQVRHLLPTVSDTAVLIKASFTRPLTGAPSLRIGSATVRGRMNDTKGEFWQFHAADLQPGRRYTLSLKGADGRSLCSPWDLSTFPSADARPDRFRVLFFTCAGGREGLTFLPTATRSRLLRRALTFRPDAVVANGDHVYWDLLSPVGAPYLGAWPDAKRLAGSFSRSSLVFGDTNETVLKLAAGPQIIPVYGTDFRSTPVFFIQDDHDYFDNDDADDTIVTFPPSAFMLRLARASQQLYYPEFLPDAMRPAGLPWSSFGDRDPGLSESFGTLRFGRLAESWPPRVRPLFFRRPRACCRPAGPSDLGGSDVVVECCWRSASCRSRSAICFACSAICRSRSAMSRGRRSCSASAARARPRRAAADSPQTFI